MAAQSRADGERERESVTVKRLTDSLFSARRNKPTDK